MLNPPGQPLAQPGAKNRGKPTTVSAARARQARRNRSRKFAGVRGRIGSHHTSARIMTQACHSREFQTPTFPDKLVVAVRRLNSVSDGKVGVLASGKLEKGERDSNSETFHCNPAG